MFHQVYNFGIIVGIMIIGMIVNVFILAWPFFYLFILWFSIMEEQILVALQVDHSLPQVMTMRHQSMNMVKLFQFMMLCSILTMLYECEYVIKLW